MLTFGERLKQIRKSKGITQGTLADLSNISLTSIKKYESDIRKPKIEGIKKLAAALDVTMDTLTGERMETDEGYDYLQYSEMIASQLSNFEMKDIIKIMLTTDSFRHEYNFNYFELPINERNKLIDDIYNSIGYEIYKLKNK